MVLCRTDALCIFNIDKMWWEWEGAVGMMVGCLL